MKPGHIQIFTEYIAIFDGENYTRLTLDLTQKIQLLSDLSSNVAHLIRSNELRQHLNELEQGDQHPLSASPGDTYSGF